MSIRTTAVVSALTAATPQSLGSVSLGAPYAKVLGFTMANWASSAKAAEGTDTAQKVSLTDAAGRVIYLDAADFDYGAASGAAIGVGFHTTLIGQDDTSTGLLTRAVDATGAAATAGAGVPIIAKSPVTVAVLNGGTATDYVEVALIVEV
jgi:hypothetical protein